MSNDLLNLIDGTTRPRVLVVGDVILDRYLWGDVDRISPEAPIPLVRVTRQEHRLGGAGSVVSMLAALEADVHVAAVVGTDGSADVLREMFSALGVGSEALLAVDDRPTTVKERFLGMAQSRHPQQVVRVDYEDDEALSEAKAAELIELIEGVIGAVDAVLLSDYKKGVCTTELVKAIVERAGALGIPVAADPIRGGDYGRYAGCRCITPNRLEAGLALGRTIYTPAAGVEAAKDLLDFGLESAIVTLDRDGMAWANRQGESGIAPVRPRQVYDITGAGDMVLSIVGLCLAADAPLATTVELANVAASLEVERLGAVPITRQELRGRLTEEGKASASKVVDLATLQMVLAERRAAGERIVMTNGCFDLLHPGHVSSLAAARRLGDCLIVGLNSDQSVRQLKSADRPIIDEQGRAAMLAALECVNYVVLFDEVEVTNLVGEIRPDVLAKAAQYAVDEVVGHEIVESYGGTVSLVPIEGDYSTTRLIEKIRAENEVKSSRGS